MKLNTTAITNAIIAALTHGDAFEAEMLKLQGLLKGTEREAVKDIVAPVVAAHYGETFADGKWADSKCAAKRKANRIIASIVGTAPKQANKVVVDKKLVKSLSSTIIAAGLTKKQFDALLSELRASISFE
jgi:hypothetical protein